MYNTSELSPRVKVLRDRADVDGEKARAIAQKAVDGNRDLTAEEQAAYDLSLKSLKETLEADVSTGMIARRPAASAD